jgi:hypothetical protein
MTTDYYKRGHDIGTAGIQRQKIDDEAKDRELKIRKQTGELDDAEFARARTRKQIGEREALDAPPQAGLPAPAAPPIGSSDVAQPAAAAPAPLPVPTAGDRLRLAARQAYSNLDPNFRKIELEAKNADFDDAFAKGAQEADLDKFSRVANLKNPSLMIHKLPGKSGYEILVMRPDGETHKVPATEAQARQIAGFRAAMAVDAEKALQGIAKIDADLATLFQKEYDMAKDTVNANNQGRRFQEAGANEAVRAQQVGVGLAREARLEKESNLQNEIAGQAAGLRQGYETARALGPEGAPAAAIYKQHHGNAQTRGAGAGIKVPSLNEKPEINSEAYHRALKAAVESGAYPDAIAARMAVDKQFGIVDDADEKVKAALAAAAEEKRNRNKRAAPPSRSASGVVTNSPR